MLCAFGSLCPPGHGGWSIHGHTLRLQRLDSVRLFLLLWWASCSQPMHCGWNVSRTHHNHLNHCCIILWLCHCWRWWYIKYFHYQWCYRSGYSDAKPGDNNAECGGGGGGDDDDDDDYADADANADADADEEEGEEKMTKTMIALLLLLLLLLV